MLKPRKIKQFYSIIFEHLKLGEREGASAMGFSPDSTKLVLGMHSCASVLVLNLAEQCSDRHANERRKWQPSILRQFDYHKVSRKSDTRYSWTSMPMLKSNNNLSRAPGVGVEISSLAISPDGQWMATTDDCCQTHVYNFDALQVISILC